MDPGAFDERERRAALLRRLRASEAQALGARFAPPWASAVPTLVAAASGGGVHVFRLHAALAPEHWERVERRECVYPTVIMDLSGG